MTFAWRAAVLLLLASTWWHAGGGEWANGVYWRAAVSAPARAEEEPRPAKAGDGDVLEMHSREALQDLQSRATVEAWAASQASSPSR